MAQQQFRKKNLVLVESPAKAKTITKYLNSNPSLKALGTFVVMASMGHVRDLKKKELGIDIDAGFVPDYQVTPEKLKLVAEIKKAAADADMVWLASDYDREGEGIAMHLREVLKLKKYKRITFTEITSRALEQAVLNPRMIDEHLVDSQETRRILDRLVGFKLSPVLWKRFRTDNMSGLSAGRVQSAVMHILVAREKEIADFDSGTYWYFQGTFVLKMKSESHDLQDVKLYLDTNVYKETAQAKVLKLLNNLKQVYSIIDVKNSESKKNADLPFITSTLQQEANAKFGFGLKYTMQLAQELYEKGYITYMRTDSYAISDDFKVAAQTYILREYGQLYYGGGSSKRRAAQKNAQEAHEAIRPTDVERREVGLKPDHQKLYDMIWKRTVAYFMTPCVSDELKIKIADASFQGASHPLYFMTTFTKVKFNGFMVVYGVKNETYNFTQYIDGIRNGQYKLTCNSIVAKNTWQSPPQRFNESSMIKVLESEGIGRPSTYASIMTKLLEKQYVVKSDISGQKKPTVSYVLEKPGKIVEERDSVVVGQERTRLVPTDIGTSIDGFLSEHFGYIVDKSFTANMEADLDRIAEGEKGKLQVLNLFWKQFGSDVRAFDGMKSAKVVLKSANFNHKVDGKEYIVRLAKYGPVIEYTDSEEGNKKKFIGLKPYMSYVRKELGEIDENDIRMLLDTPRVFCEIRGKPFMLAYGPYGFYGKYEGDNIALSRRTILNIMKNTYTEDELQSAIDYKKMSQGKSKGDADGLAPPSRPSKKFVTKKIVASSVKKKVIRKQK